MKYGAVLLLVAGIGYGGAKAYNYIYWLPCFEVSAIRIEGNRVLNPSQIRQLAGLCYQQNIFEVDTDLARDSLEAHPYVKRAWVSRKLPSTICIRVQERSRFALLNSASLYVVDEEGVVLEELKGVSWPDLPIINGGPKQRLPVGKRCASAALEQGLQILKCLREARLLGDISEVNVRDSYCPLFYTLREGVEVRLGEGQIKQKLAYMKTVWEDLNARIKEVESLDLRYQDMVVVRFKQPENMV
jgi:cell division protein FtsQ